MASNALTDETLEELVAHEIDDPGALLYVLKLASDRGSFSQSSIDHQLRNFVFLSLERLEAEYGCIFARFWDAPETAQSEFQRYVIEFAISKQAPASDPVVSDPALDWPWPCPEPPPSRGGEFDADWPNKYSGLYLCGYVVGKKGMEDRDREKLLDYFFRKSLPFVVSQYHNDDYGEPGTEKRLQKIANVIAANCRNFKRNSRERYAVAISHYEIDLEHLRRTYYRTGTFPWPPIEP